MDINRFTEKAQESLGNGQRLAMRLGQQQVDVEHLLLALLDQAQGLAAAILAKADVSVEALKVRVQRELEKLPRVSGSDGSADQVHVSKIADRHDVVLFEVDFFNSGLVSFWRRACRKLLLDLLHNRGRR